MEEEVAKDEKLQQMKENDVNPRVVAVCEAKEKGFLWDGA